MLNALSVAEPNTRKLSSIEEWGQTDRLWLELGEWG